MRQCLPLTELGVLRFCTNAPAHAAAANVFPGAMRSWQVGVWAAEGGSDTHAQTNGIELCGCSAPGRY